MLDDLGSLDPGSTVPPYRQIAAHLRSQIVGRAPGTKLPSESQLTSHYGVARMTVRAAMRALQDDGLVRSRQGAGVFVVDPAATSDPAAPRPAEATGITPDFTVHALSAATALLRVHSPEEQLRHLADLAAAVEVGTGVVRRRLVDDRLEADVRAASRQLAAASRRLRQAAADSTVAPEDQIAAARDLARHHLAEALPRRWAHVQAVAARAAVLAMALDEPDGAALCMAAWLHDIGYAPSLAHNGFHPLDGAGHLRASTVDARVVALVAHHSAAASEAAEVGLADELAAFVDEGGIVRDLLWFCDMTTGPDGQPMTFGQRMDEVRARYGPDHYVTRAMAQGMPAREQAVARAWAWICEHGLASSL
ncbi:hypothetical protein GCM10009836_44750 [Pseudonocardia ailaonensis]|uniref:HTH gntR-type domain-containing protein n=1 Tax=Pseudonocardia ailaonensis TaxID=367279 RepID=A0ABN2N9V2_9PSEU